MYMWCSNRHRKIEFDSILQDFNMASSIYASPSFIGHSLWMVPRAGSKCVVVFLGLSFVCAHRRCWSLNTAALKAFQDIVTHQAKALGSPTFLPHITLLAGVEVYKPSQSRCLGINVICTEQQCVVLWPTSCLSIKCLLAQSRCARSCLPSKPQFDQLMLGYHHHYILCPQSDGSDCT